MNQLQIYIQIILFWNRSGLIN